jgi:hypothetical protein
MLSFYLILNLITSLMMAGIVWFMQVVQFPLFTTVRPRNFLGYGTHFKFLTAYIMAPMFLLEAIGALGLAIKFYGHHNGLLIGNLVLFAIAWGATLLYTLPIQNKLTERYVPARIRSLIHYNWVRTLAWSGKGALAVLLVIKYLQY